MCGIAGVIHRDGPGDIGQEITRMLQSMKHRGPDSTGYALYGPPGDLVVIRFVLAEPGETGFGLTERLERNRIEVETRLAKIGAKVDRVESQTGYAFRALIRYDGELKPLADYLEDIEGCEVLSLGRSLEIVKDLGDAETVHEQYRLDGFQGTHAIGHVRMANRVGRPTWRVRTPTGRTRSPTWRWCTTASSPTTTSGSVGWRAGVIASSRSVIRRSSPCTWPT